MNSFEINIRHQLKNEDHFPVVIEHTRPDTLLPVETRGKFYFDEELQQQLTSLALNPEKYGEWLGQTLFTGDVLLAFTEARGVSQTQNKQEALLRIFLSVDAPELKPLHWEWLAAPLPSVGWRTLARSQNFPFAIHLASSTGQPYPPIGRHDLKALVIIANPSDLDKYRLASFRDDLAVRHIQTALEPVVGSENLKILAAMPGAGDKDRPTVDNLLEALTATHYPILHVVAHGQFVKSIPDTNLYLANKDNSTHVVSGSWLVKQLQGLDQPPRFAFLGVISINRGKGNSNKHLA